MVMSCHGEFSFCWDRSCGALPPRSPATERLLSTESCLASAQRVCWINEVNEGATWAGFWANLSPLIPGPPGGLPSWTAVPHLHLAKGKNKPVFDKNRTHLEAAVSSRLAEWSWLLAGIPWCEAPGQMGVTILLSQHSCPVGILPCFVLRQPMRESPDFFLFLKKINKTSILPNLLQY